MRSNSNTRMQTPIKFVVFDSCILPQIFWAFHLLLFWLSVFFFVLFCCCCCKCTVCSRFLVAQMCTLRCMFAWIIWSTIGSVVMTNNLLYGYILNWVNVCYGVFDVLHRWKLNLFHKTKPKKKIWQNSWHESESVEIVIWCSFGSLRWWTKCELIKSGNLRFQDPLGSLLFVSTHKLCVTFACVCDHTIHQLKARTRTNVFGGTHLYLLNQFIEHSWYDATYGLCRHQSLPYQ